MSEDNNGKLLVYASSFASLEDLLTPVMIAAEKMANALGMHVEIKTFDERFTPIYIYYKKGDEEPIPIYCNNGQPSDKEKICATLRNMMFVLSFHPKHEALRQVRKEIMRFS